MSDWIGIAVVVFLVLCGFFGLAQITKPYEVTPEEFERRAKEAPGFLSAGLSGLQKMLDPAENKAMAVQEDFKQGYYNKGQESGDKPEAGDEATNNLNQEHESDA